MTRRPLAALAGAAVSAVAVVGAADIGRNDTRAQPLPAKIVFVDVGQGDGVVMQIGGKIVVSDAGELFPERVDAALRKVGAKRIDVAIFSHAHDDHVKNFIRLIRDFKWKIGRVVMPASDWWKGTDTNRELSKLVEDVPHDVVTRGDRFDWGGADWEILNPPFGQFTGNSQAANASVAYLLTVNGVHALFTGDIEERVALNVASELQTKLSGPVDIFLATHHGSRHGSTTELLDVAKPRWAVVSVGANNPFKHPSPEALGRLEQAGASIWCTDTNGTITARVSTKGRVTWQVSGKRKPWWSARDHRRRGTCAGR
jgi:competence protein ComEC